MAELDGPGRVSCLRSDHGRASLVAQVVKNLPAMQETWVQSLVRKIPERKEWQPTPLSLPGEFQGQRSLAGYSPSGCRVTHD